MKLLIDAGNRRIKWAGLQHGALTEPSSAPFDRDAPALPASMFDAAAPDAIVVSNVAGPGVAAAIREAAAARFGLEPRFVTASALAFGVRNGYTRPDQLGADRWVAMIGAFVELGGPVCIVDAGTAFTIDVIAENGEHLGGLIVPGLELMAGGLRTKTSDLAALECAAPAAGANELARNTADALRMGPLLALAALVERTVERAERRLGAAVRTILTGGDAGPIRDAIARDTAYNPALVLRGLAEFARGSDA